MLHYNCRVFLLAIHSHPLLWAKVAWNLFVMKPLYTESLRTLKIIHRNLNEIVRSWIWLQNGQQDNTSLYSSFRIAELFWLKNAMTSFGWKKRKVSVKSVPDISAFQESEQVAVSITIQYSMKPQGAFGWVLTWKSCNEIVNIFTSEFFIKQH